MAGTEHDDLKEELLAVIRANRDLGPEYDDQTVAQILETVRHSAAAASEHLTPAPWHDPHWDRLSARERRQLLRAWRRSTRPWPLNYLTPVYALSIPLLAIAAGTADALGVLGVLGLDAIATVGILLKTRPPGSDRPGLR
ncbi:MAG: hypothetical protein OWU84_11975 [Firmicutes bacterium]|nr:hypothetical protein [Bacillota bacterium]